jgi:hypothetical protein
MTLEEIYLIVRIVLYVTASTAISMCGYCSIKLMREQLHTAHTERDAALEHIGWVRTQRDVWKEMYERAQRRGGARADSPKPEAPLA